MKNPRVAYLLKKFPRLSETFVLNEILGQERLGRPLHVFSRREPDDEPRHPQLAELRAEVEVLPPKSELDPWRLMFDEDCEPEELFPAVGSVVAAAREWEHPRFSQALSEALFLLRRTRELGIAHVHTHFATDSAVTAMLLHDLGGPTYSVTAHAKDIYRNTVDPHVLTRMFERAEFVVTVCDANVRHLEVRVGPDAIARVRRLYNGVDLDTFAFRPTGRDEDHVLGVGRLVEKKGFDVLIEAIARLRAEGRRLRCTIVGEGEERERLETLVRDRGLEGTVELAGARDQDVVRELLSSATVLCLPCIVGEDGNRDALPTVLLEALASGLPTVSTPVTGVPEILDDGRVGRLVPEHDVAATAEALARLLDDPTERARVAHEGRERAARLFDARTNARTLHDWFDEALSKREASCGSSV